MRDAILAFFTMTMLATAGCGTHEPGGDCGRGDADGAYYPLARGAWWYDVETTTSEASPVSVDKVVYCCAKQAMPLRPEVTGFPLVRHTTGGHALRWQEVDAAGNVRRHYDEGFWDDGSREGLTYYCPSKLHVLGEEVPGGYVETWSELELSADDEAGWQACLSVEIDPLTCVPDEEPDPEQCTVTGPTSFEREWSIEGTAEQVTVPAGTFETTHFHTLESSDGDVTDDKHWYWARGVGKVREDSVNEAEPDEELHEFCIPIGPDPSDPPFYSELTDKCP